MCTKLIEEPLVFKKVVESIGDGLFILDNKGLIVFWNRSMERICGYKAEEVLGKTCKQVNCSQCFGKTCPEGIHDCGILQKGGAELKECTIKHRQGFEVPVIKNASVVHDETGSPLGVVETVTDLTALHRMRLKALEAECRGVDRTHLGSIIGKSTEIQDVYKLIKAAAESDVTVLIQGESGTGKELVASAIHEASRRKDAAMVTVNCSSLTENLLESELFGHSKGAFTGALNHRTGRFETAHGGTVLLDEVGELPPYIQVKLLRVLQERVVCRVGENMDRKIDIRIIGATHRDIFGDVKAGFFREDLYYRLKVFPIQIPPLRRRKGDISLLIEYFIGLQNRKYRKRIKSLSTEAMRRMMDYHWPGNVRELKNAIEHAFVLCTNAQIQLSDLPIEIRDPYYALWQPVAGENPHAKRRKKPTKKELLKLLKALDWNKSEVSRKIGLSRTSIWKYMKKYNIPLSPPREINE